ncbi:uncharacterized protein F5891DRAFT_1258269 [Suillus fuscotomentosus]|uniref:Uncharacterized protein n=1 Tax=Suillus fuscotomentosus TaxID=1912939 RepID=A0AAD4DWC2_9AGAM|nr:uncharacterized protein F5891DRAFT_1258269 [Suillus fuscotomentosus]KAG1893808.1 hypothetical protein F5891DRAFT_1258269 [Suillus fuscotomentosus]
MPKTPRYFTESVTVTPKNIPATARDYARASCTKYFMERVDGMQSLEVPIQRGHIPRSLDRDPQPVQQDQQDHYSGIEENYFAGYDASGDVHDTTTASLDDEDTGLTRLSTETVARLKFPLKFTPSREGITTAAVKLYLPHSASDKDAQDNHRASRLDAGMQCYVSQCCRHFSNGWIQGIQSRISFKPVQSHVLHRLTSRWLTLYDSNVISIPSKDNRELTKDREGVSLNDITHQSRHQQCRKSRRRAESNGGAHCDS